jgi:hypothetical protein
MASDLIREELVYANGDTLYMDSAYNVGGRERAYAALMMARCPEQVPENWRVEVQYNSWGNTLLIRPAGTKQKFIFSQLKVKLEAADSLDEIGRLGCSFSSVM